jgi:hypothetical protein
MKNLWEQGARRTVGSIGVREVEVGRAAHEGMRAENEADTAFITIVERAQSALIRRV